MKGVWTSPHTDPLQVAQFFLKQTVLQRDMKFVVLYAICRVITAFTWPQQWSLSRDRSIQSTSHPTSVMSISVLPFNSRITFQELLPLRFQTDILWHFSLLPCMLHALSISFFFGKIFGVFDYANLFSLVPGGLNRKGNSILISSVINL
jgi:hypothetical protein